MGETPAGTAPYRVLARKYRPRNFDDLTGHDVMVRTLRNAFASGRIAHAYILTGAHGVGKTTTARILARALNYTGADGTDTGPQMEMPEDGRHCRAIAEGRHPDVLEMDAASHTGVADIRNLIDSVQYAPVQARYRVYIIDEVHMLSTAAFNALLKTLEEPPQHAKFIFATTEIRKLPLTVLSRCQRFDLRRLDSETLSRHLSAIAVKEQVAIDREALAIIARAAAGSVRDALSMMDQAIAMHTHPENEAGISARSVRTMLGLADRSRILELFAAILDGKPGTMLACFREQYDCGADPCAILDNLLEITHLLTRIKAAGPEAATHGPGGEAGTKDAVAMAEKVPMNALTRIWSLLLKALEETRTAPDPVAAAEIGLVRVCYATLLPTPDEALKALKKKPDGLTERAGTRESGTPGLQDAAQLPPTAIQASPDGKDGGDGIRLTDFGDVVNLAGRMRDFKLRAELENYVHVVAFAPGRIDVRLHDCAPPELPATLGRKLASWTGRQWIVNTSPGAAGEETLRQIRERNIRTHPAVRQVLDVFPEAAIAAIRENDGPQGQNT